MGGKAILGSVGALTVGLGMTLANVSTEVLVTAAPLILGALGVLARVLWRIATAYQKLNDSVERLTAEVKDINAKVGRIEVISESHRIEFQQHLQRDHGHGVRV